MSEKKLRAVFPPKSHGLSSILAGLHAAPRESPIERRLARAYCGDNALLTNERRAWVTSDCRGAGSFPNSCLTNAASPAQPAKRDAIDQIWSEATSRFLRPGATDKYGRRRV